MVSCGVVEGMNAVVLLRNPSRESVQMRKNTCISTVNACTILNRNNTEY